MENIQKMWKKGWECIIPFYNTWVLVEIAELNWWWFFLLMAPTIAGIFFNDSSYFVILCRIGRLFAYFQCYYNISKKFHKGTAFAIAMTLVPFIALPILAFGQNNEFDSNVEVSSNGVFAGNQSTHTTSNSNIKYCVYCGREVNPNSKFCANCGKEIK